MTQLQGVRPPASRGNRGLGYGPSGTRLGGFGYAPGGFGCGPGGFSYVPGGFGYVPGGSGPPGSTPRLAGIHLCLPVPLEPRDWGPARLQEQPGLCPLTGDSDSLGTALHSALSRLYDSPSCPSKPCILAEEADVRAT